MKYLLLFAALAVFSAPCLSGSFKPPGPAQRLGAIGPTRGLPPALAAALDPGEDFEPIPEPLPGYWLAEHPEPGQTFEEFSRGDVPKPDGARRKIYLKPLGEFAPERSPSLETLREYASLYFALEAEVLPAMPVTAGELTTRVNPLTRNRQVLTTDVLARLERSLPEDAFCLMAVTTEDLYPHPSWNFVFGQASPRASVGVFSFARYDPAFYGEARDPDHLEAVSRRSLKVLVHEAGHMFYLAHCIFFRCVMNGSNHLAESDSRPLFLCPVCLRKLQHTTGFDVEARYRGLLDFYRKTGFEEEAGWVAARLGRISAKDRE